MLWILREKSQRARIKFMTVTNYYTHLQEPIIASTANKVKLVVNKLYPNKHIDETTFKWLNNSENLPRIPEFYTLTKIHKPNLAGAQTDSFRKRWPYRTHFKLH